MKCSVVASALIVLCLLPVATRANFIGVGDVEFNIIIPGLNDFTINNFTGPLGLPPDFPVADNLMFNGAVLTLTQSDGSVDTVNLGNVAPGTLDGSVNPSLLFPDTTSFSMANFTATLSQTSFSLADGSTFVAASAAISLTLLPSSGVTLSPAVDLGALTVTPAPEPASLILLGTGLVAIVGARLKPRMGKH